MEPRISIIAALTPQRVIGKKGDGLLWYLPEDLKRFKKLTTGHIVIMGRKTFETLGKPLPNRTNIVITRDQRYRANGCLVVHSLKEALEIARRKEMDSARSINSGQAGSPPEIFIMGGGEIYEQAINLADKLYLTLVHQSFEGDVFFPDYSEFKKVVFKQEGESANGLKFTFFELER